MPIKEFYCTRCEKAFEVLMWARETSAPPCPGCKDSEYLEVRPTVPGSYKINGDNSASTSPKGGAFKSTKGET